MRLPVSEKLPWLGLANGGGQFPQSRLYFIF